MENEQMGNDLAKVIEDEKTINLLRIHQDFFYAFVGGLFAAFISAIIWAVVTVATEYQIGFMAIGVGFLVGFTVQFFGAGIDKKFGYLGALLSLLGCLSGNLFSVVGFIAQEQSLGYFETLSYLSFGLMVNILIESFNPIDLLFYGIAIYEGYKFAFRRITTDVLLKLGSGNHAAYPSFYKLRFPMVMVCLLFLALFFYQINQGVSGHKTFTYESGKKMSEGELKNSKEHGIWTYYFEDGSIQSVGFFNMGIPDSLWQWYNEKGQLNKIGYYKNGLEHDIWINYYNNGIVCDSGSYIDGRMNGFWIYRYESGNLSQCGYFKRNLQDSIWQSYFDNGQLSSTGKMKDGVPIGDWTTFFDNGQKAEEIHYTPVDQIYIKNVWDRTGKQLVVDGTGIYKSFASNGTVISAGQLENGSKIGKWFMYFENGKLKEEGKFDNETYLLINSWDNNGNQLVKEGFGMHKSYYEDETSILETGEIKNGLRNGLWKMLYLSNANVSQEIQYDEGKLNGTQKYFFESGAVYAEGEMVNGLREGEWNWFYENGLISSSVRFSKDKKEGEQSMWSETGKKTKEEYYENGLLIEEKIL